MKKSVYFLILVAMCIPWLAFSQKTIDCNSKPSTPDTYVLVSSQPDGNYILNPTDIKFLSFESKTTATKGSDMIKKLDGKGLNACIFDYLMDHQDMVPETWKGKEIVFTGSVFKDAGGNELMRAMYWWNDEWSTKVVYLSEAYDDKVAALK
jgi:hypothetical protein